MLLDSVTFRAVPQNRQSQQVTLERVRETLLSTLAERLQEVEALGIFGSLARRSDFSERSDIDVFVIVREKEPAGVTDQRWWLWVKGAGSCLVWTVHIISRWAAIEPHWRLTEYEKCRGSNLSPGRLGAREAGHA